MSNNRMNRRRILQTGGTALATVLAGCNGMDNENNNNNDPNENQDPGEDKNQQEYTVPPVAYMESDGEPEDGLVTVRLMFETATTPGDPNVYFEDEITFELFVYDKYPVGNDVTLTKVGETVSTPHNVINETVEIPYEDIPKNQQIRFRLKVTNNNTGDSQWEMDQRVFGYIDYGENVRTVLNKEGLSVLESPSPFVDNRFVQEDGSYRLYFGGEYSFPSSGITEEVPYSREAFKIENDEYGENEGPVCKPIRGTKITMPSSHVGMTEEMMEMYNVGEYYNSFVFSGNVPSEYDYYGRNQYDVLDNPIYNQMAETINKAHSLYGVNNHYSKIRTVSSIIQNNEYDQITGSIRNAPIHLPEAYWADPAENCVGHSFQLCWLLYHMGYTCGTVWLDRSGRNASHLGVGIPVPESVMEEDFPDGYPSTFTNEDVESTYYIENISDLVGPDSRPDTLGEHPWVYIEATQPNPFGVIPFDDVEQASVKFAIEPEDNVFDTDIGTPQ